MDDDLSQHYQGSPELLMFLASTVHDMKNSISVLSGTLEHLLTAAPPAKSADSTESAAAAAVTAAAGADAAEPGAQSAPAAAAEPAQYQQLGQMLYQTRRLNDSLIQLLALYKEVGKPGYPFDPSPRSVRELVEQVEGQARVLLQSRGIAFETDFAPDAIWTFDEELVLGVLVHAINNAIRYTRDRIRLTVRVDGDYLELRVQDNGDGFPPAMLEAGASADGTGTGTGAVDGRAARVRFSSNSSGLGLYFSSEVARMHRHRQRSGNISLHNGSGDGGLAGGCFVLRLP